MSRKTKVVYVFWLHPYIAMIPIGMVAGFLFLGSVILPGLATIPLIWINPSLGEKTDSSPESLKSELQRVETLQRIPHWFNESGIDAEIMETLQRVRKQAKDESLQRDVLWALASLYGRMDRHQEAADTYREVLKLPNIKYSSLVPYFQKNMQIMDCYRKTSQCSAYTRRVRGW